MGVTETGVLALVQPTHIMVSMAQVRVFDSGIETMIAIRTEIETADLHSRGIWIEGGPYSKRNRHG